MNTKPKLSLNDDFKKKRLGLLVLAVLVLALIVIISQVFISLLIIQMEVEISGSTLQSIDVPETNYKQIIVELVVYNPGGQRIGTVWVEITNQDTNISFSKSKLIQIDFKQSKKVTIEFTIDKNTYPGQFDHRVWLTYPEFQD